MEPFTRLTAVAAPFDTPDIDTDMMIPQRFLRKPLTVGYRNFLFFNDRFDAAGKEKPDFILHREPVQESPHIRDRAQFRLRLDARRRRLRSHRLRRARGDCAELRRVLREQQLSERAAARRAARCRRAQAARAMHAKPGAEITIDLPSQTVTGPDGAQYKFDIEPSRKERMLEGLDDISITERYEDAMKAFEKKLDAEMPWMAAKELEVLVQK